MRRLAALTSLFAMALLPALAHAAIEASFTCTPSCAVTPGTSVTFSSTTTSDSAVRLYEWDLDGDGLYGAADAPGEPAGSAQTTATVDFPAAGDHTVGLRVTNVAREASAVTRTVTVRAAPPSSPAPPIALEPPVAQEPARPTPPPPGADGDRDATSDGADLCPQSIPGARSRYAGCSRLDLLASPYAAIGDAVARTQDARRALARQRGMAPRMRGHGVALARGLKRFRTAAARLPLQPCIASRDVASGLRSATTAISAVGRAGSAARRAVIVDGTRRNLRRPAAKRDADALGAQIAGIAAQVDHLRRMAAKLRAVGRLIAEACRASRGTRSVRARVVSVDSAGSHAKLSDGTTLILGGAAKITGLARGVTVSASGVAVRGGVLVARNVTGQGIELDIPPALLCTFTNTIAPVQDFTKGPASVLHYDERGYRHGGVYHLEGGMGIGATTSCPQRNHALNVYLDYVNTEQHPVKKLIGVLAGRPTVETPARLPMDVAAATKAKLRFELYELDCEHNGDVLSCSQGQLLAKTSSPAEVRPQGGWGEAQYDARRYSVEDGSADDFAVATLTGVKTKGAVAQGGPFPGIFGVGYGVNGNASTRPHAQYILQGEQFALHDKTPPPPKDAYFDDVSGVPGGLLWAYVHGQRNGHVYHYVATLPNIVTDVVSVCSPTTYSFYRLPWDDGTTEKVTQGNSGALTHQGAQSFAFDFVMENHETIHAARGGVVESVEESLNQHSGAAVVSYVKKLLGEDAAGALWKPGNHLIIRHPDGSFSYYTHMQKNGVHVNENAFVERGDAVATVGNTGNTTGPHLHFHVMTNVGVTIKIRFEVAAVFDATAPIPCVVPSNGAWVSTNR